MRSESVAWVIASDGCIGMSKSRRKMRTGKVGTQLQIRVTVANKNKEFIQKFQELCPEYLGRLEQSRSSGVINWVLNKHKDIKAFLEELVPHLPIKYQQAKLAIEFCEIRLRSARGKKYGEREFEIYDQMRQLNSGGS